MSIIIPTYNAGKILSSCLTSIVSQSLGDFEIVIADGGSTDNTLEIVKDYSQKNVLIQLVSEKDEGIYSAMNKGIKMAKGTWLYFMGSDDVIYDKEVFKNVFAQKSDANIIYGNITWLPSNIAEQGEWNYSKFLDRNINHQRIFYQSSLFERYDAFNTSYKVASDHELNIRFFCNPLIKWKYIPLYIAKYHAHGYSADKIDFAFWDNWKNIVLKNFSLYLPKSTIYSSLNWYCWYNIQQRNYRKGFRLFITILLHSYSFSFIKHSLSQTIKSIRKH